MTTAVLWLISIAIPLAQPQPTPATTAAPPVAAAQEEDPAFIRRLEAIDAFAAGITDLTAEFQQRRVTTLLKKPLVSSGVVRLKGSKIRWDTRAPTPSVLAIDPTTLKVFYPEQRSLEVYPVASGLARLAATPLPRLKIIREQFSIRECKVSEMDNVPADSAGAAVALLLLPRSDELKKYVREVRVLLDEPPKQGETSGQKQQTEERGKHPYGVARQMEVTDADGDRTIVVFKEVRTNPGLTDADLELLVPEGTRISRPLEGAPPPAPNSADRKDGK